jgi:hypothetical protein
VRNKAFLLLEFLVALAIMMLCIASIIKFQRACTVLMNKSREKIEVIEQKSNRLEEL